MDLEAQRLATAHSAVRLEYLTLVVAVGEALVALISGILAGSVALVAFGADSVIETISGFVVLGQLLTLAQNRSAKRWNEHRSHRFLAVLFYTLALYVVVSAGWSILGRHHPHENVLGIAVSIFSAVAMPLLAWSKRTTAHRLSEHGLASLSRLLLADAAETALCSLLAVSTLIGVSLAWRHWWWADAVASLAVVYFALREGREAWECEA
ncbi:MAG: cation transporter [Acidimicrobiaceae bacterium]|nr:cation transporter [Acidimicrobiaceae bacterium]